MNKEPTKLSRLRNWLESAEAKKIGEVSTALLDVWVKLAGVSSNPMMIIPAVGSVLGAVSTALSSAHGPVIGRIATLGLVPTKSSADLVKFLYKSEMIEHLGAESIVKDDAKTELLRISVGNERYVYLLREPSYNSVELYTEEGDETACGALIERVFAMVGTDSVELVASDESYAIKPLLGMFSEHNENLILKLAQTVHDMALMGESPACLYYGAPGTGKTTAALSLAQLMRKTTILVGPHTVDELTTTSFWTIIDGIKPDMVIFDDLDKAETMSSLYTVLNTLRAKYPKIIIIITANDTTKFGGALLRPGRAGELIEFKVPAVAEKADILARSGCPQHLDAFTLADGFRSDCSHDWVRDAAWRMKKAKTLDEAMAIVVKTNERFVVANNVKEEDEDGE